MLDGSGEYTLVYEDEEGDRMLVGDVPWKYVRVLLHLFFSFRLKVLLFIYLESKFYVASIIYKLAFPDEFTFFSTHSRSMFVSTVKRLRVLRTSDLSASFVSLLTR